MFKDLQEAVSKELKEGIRMLHQIQNIKEKKLFNKRTN